MKFLWLLTLSLSLFAQQHSTRRVQVPFVGCRSEGQADPLDAPKGGPVSVIVSSDDARQFAYYKSEAVNIGVLAPRAWQCLGVYGSGGGWLIVTPRAIDTPTFFSTAFTGFKGPVVDIVFRNGNTSGLYSFAEIIGRIFPMYRSFARNVYQEMDEPLPNGPYPADQLTYRSKMLVEYKTPAEAEGLGTYWWINKNDRPIEGMAMLLESPPSLIQLSIRLPRDLEGLTRAIINQVEHDTKSLVPK